MATTLEDIDNPTPERFTEHIALWMNTDATAPNWVFAIRALTRRVTYDGTTVTFIMKNGAVYTVAVSQTTQPVDIFQSDDEEAIDTDGVPNDLENADERQALVFKGHGTDAIVRKLRQTAMAMPDRCDGWTVGNPNEGESHATMQYIEGYEAYPELSWEFHDTDIHREGETEVDTFEAILDSFISRSISNINFRPTPVGVKRLAKGQVI